MIHQQHGDSHHLSALLSHPGEYQGPMGVARKALAVTLASFPSANGVAQANPRLRSFDPDQNQLLWPHVHGAKRRRAGGVR